MKIIDVNVVNFFVVGLFVLLWRFLATMLAAWKPESKLATAVGLISG